jgi:hypothetical protein
MRGNLCNFSFVSSTMVMSAILLRTNANINLLARSIINSKQLSRERTLDKLSVVSMILMFAEIKSSVFGMKFISHQ